MTGAADTWTGKDWEDDEETKRRLRGEGDDQLRPTDSEENVFVLIDPGDTPLPRRRGPGASASVAPPRLGQRLTDQDAPYDEPRGETTERWDREPEPDTADGWEREPEPDTADGWEREPEPEVTERSEREPAVDRVEREEPETERAAPPPPPRRREAREAPASSSSEDRRASAASWGSGPPDRASGRSPRKRRLRLTTKLAIFGGLSFGLSFVAARFLPPKHAEAPSGETAPSAPAGAQAGTASAPAGSVAGATGDAAPGVSPEAPDLLGTLAPAPTTAGLKVPMRQIIGRRGTVVLTNGEEIDGRFLGFERSKLLLGLAPSGRAGIPFTRIADLRLQDGTSVWEQSFTEREQAIERQEAKRRAMIGGGERP